MTEQQRFMKKPVEISATQWFRNGDHPLDHDPIGIEKPCAETRRRYDDYLATEGKVVRYYRHPEVSGKDRCQKCNNVMHHHGWIDTLEGGHIVCPGDWIITGVQGEHYPCKPDIFEATYQPAGDQHPDDAAVDLSALLHEHVAKGDPLDVGNLAMMLHQNGQRVAALSHAEGEPFAYCFTDVNGRPTEFTDGQPGAPEDLRIITPLFKHPAPQVAVPEGWREEFDQFWDAQTGGRNEWTTLERLAALDAWQHAIEWVVQHGRAPTAPAGEPVAPEPDVAGLVEALTELCDEIDKHEIHSAISETSISWFKRKARKALAAHRKQGGEA